MSTPSAAVVSRLFAAHGIHEPWSALAATGIANHIYATHDVVLRVATAHEDAIDDARTESVAAPAAHAAGIRTPRLIAFDESRTLIDGPYSLWERVHADTLGLVDLPPAAALHAWRQVGRELARLHTRVTACPDPHGWLDTPGPPDDLDDVLHIAARRARASRADVAAVRRFVDDLQPALAAPVTPRFLHDDVHAGIVMCTPEGDLRALIDWGDAGWGDPALEFVAMPLTMVASAIEGYEEEAGTRFDADARARIAHGQLYAALEALEDERPGAAWPSLDVLRRLIG